MSLKFGTSGIRGLATDFSERAVHGYVNAFIDRLRAIGHRADAVLIAGDLRESTPRIRALVESALAKAGVRALDCGLVPTPVLALACRETGWAGIMVTGSHIPADRNGIKFYFWDREILKADEEHISRAYASASTPTEMPISAFLIDHYDAEDAFIRRCVSIFASNQPLRGIQTLFYSHSTAARALFPKILRQLGAEVTEFGASDAFIPVDTESTRSLKDLGGKVKESNASVLLSCDGDADRPLLIDEEGNIVPGDIIGILAARALRATHVVCPVSCNSSVEDCGAFKETERTKIGSPFVVEAMMRLSSEDTSRIVVGFEANGGFLLGSPTFGLTSLFTRDSFLPLLLVLKESVEKGLTVSQLVAQVASSRTESRLIQKFPEENTRKFYRFLDSDADVGFRAFCNEFGEPLKLDRTDGYRFTLATGGIVHFRPSGNAPEFRIYAEHRAHESAAHLADAAEKWVRWVVEA